MAPPERDLRDVVVVGSGPGGSAVARGLARGGKDVLLLERGRDWRDSPLYGTYPGALLYTDRQALLFTDQGLNIVRPLMVGGATSMYCACAAPPNPWWGKEFGIELEVAADETAAELGVAPLPAELRGTASTRIAEAGRELGMNWEPQLKFMSPERADPFRCGARCMLGCRCGAKWSAAEYVDDAVEAGAELRTHARVNRVLHEGGAVAGVEGVRRGKQFRVEAPTVIVAAGGIGSSVLLRNSGLDGAGRGMAMDTTVMVYGLAPFSGSGEDPPMTWSWADDELGVLYSTLIDPWLMFPIIMARRSPTWVLRWHRWGRTLGVMIKLTDDVTGEVVSAREIRKGLSPNDRVRLGAAETTAARILRKAGCGEDSIVATPLRGTHPSATVRVGELLSNDLETEIAGLYVCDASVFPRALGRPTVLTILALAKRLTGHLLDGRR